MIEIVVLVLLCSTNSKNAKARGKSGGAAVAYTLGLWFGAEILGAFAGAAASGGDTTPALYIMALLFAAGGGVASYFIAKSGTVVVQNQNVSYAPIGAPQNMSYQGQQAQPAYQNQQPQPTYQSQHVYQGQQQQQAAYTNQAPQTTYATQHVQTNTAYPAPQSEPVYVDVPQPTAYANQQAPAVFPAVQPQVSQTVQQQAPQTQAEPGAATVNFTAKKVMGQFLVSSVTLEVNGVPYETGFKKPISIEVPAGNVHIVCYLNYMGKSGLAQTQLNLAPNQSYQLEYKSPMVVTGSGTLALS